MFMKTNGPARGCGEISNCPLYRRSRPSSIDKSDWRKRHGWRPRPSSSKRACEVVRAQSTCTTTQLLLAKAGRKGPSRLRGDRQGCPRVQRQHLGPRLPGQALREHQCRMVQPGGVFFRSERLTQECRLESPRSYCSLSSTQMSGPLYLIYRSIYDSAH